MSSDKAARIPREIYEAFNILYSRCRVAMRCTRTRVVVHDQWYDIGQEPYMQRYIDEQNQHFPDMKYWIEFE